MSGRAHEEGARILLRVSFFNLVANFVLEA